jgi:hypothetical protein
MTVSVAAAELSIVDHCVKELLVVTVLGFQVEHSARIGASGDFSRLCLNVQQLQVDDMLFGTRCGLPRPLPFALRQLVEHIVGWDTTGAPTKARVCLALFCLWEEKERDSGWCANMIRRDEERRGGRWGGDWGWG